MLRRGTLRLVAGGRVYFTGVKPQPFPAEVLDIISIFYEVLLASEHFPKKIRHCVHSLIKYIKLRTR